MDRELVTATRRHLIQATTSSLTNSEPHSVAFVARVLSDPEYSADIPPCAISGATAGDGIYEGFPLVASTGMMVGGAYETSHEVKSRFLDGVERLRGRSETGLRALYADDLALLGIANGLAELRESDGAAVAPSKAWMLSIIDNPPRSRQCSYRMRELAGDLLDGRGRLQALPSADDLSARALEVVLRYVWTNAFAQVPAQSEEAHRQLLRDFIRAELPLPGELEKAAVWLRALDVALDRLTEMDYPQRQTAVEALEALTAIKTNLDRKAVRRAQNRLHLSFVVLLSIAAVLAWLTYKYGWDLMEPWTYFVSVAAALGSYGYFAVTNKELSPGAIYEQLIQSNKLKLYSDSGFDVTKYEGLCNETAYAVLIRESRHLLQLGTGNAESAAVVADSTRQMTWGAETASQIRPDEGGEENSSFEATPSSS